jgi:hypothetical protein
MGFQRHWGSERTLVLYNYGLMAQPVTLNALGAATRWVAEYPSAPELVAGLDGTATLSLPPQSVTVYRQHH